MRGRDRIIEDLRRRRPTRPSVLMRALAAAAALLASHAARAEITLDGDARAMVLTVSDVSRSDVVAELSRRFGFTMSGAISGDDPVSGRYRGDLGDVLGLLLPSNNFLVVYEGGQPARIVLSDRGEPGGLPPDPSMRSLRPSTEVPGEGDHGGNFGGSERQFVDPSQGMQDPAFQDPSLQDPALQDPALQDPALQAQPGEIPAPAEL